MKQTTLSLPLFPRTWEWNGRIKVSRNAVKTFNQLTLTQAKVIISIIASLWKDIVYSKEYDWAGCGDVEVGIPAELISKRHCLSAVLDSLQALTQITVRYVYGIPGIDREGITSLISTIERRKGKYYVRIPGASLPWYLYCGYGVGFVMSERNVVYQFQSIHEMRLYYELMHSVDSKTKRGSVRMSIEELRDILNVNEATTYHRIYSRCIQPLLVHLDACESEICVSATPLSERRHDRGAFAYVGVDFLIFPRSETNKQQDRYEIVLQILSKYYSKMKCPNGKEKRNLPDIVNNIIDNGYAKDFISSVIRAEEAMVRSPVGTLQRPYKMASVVAKILYKDFQISVVADAQNGFLTEK